MTIPEATHLVLQATSRAVGGEIFMLDMGEPVPITSLAEQMIRASGRVPDVDIEIKVVGTRPGEKLEERLVDDHEVVRETDHPSLLRVESPSPRGAQLHEAIGRVVSLGRSSNAAAMTQALLALARSGVASDVAAAEERSGVR
jgi:FlaA1/EpsC-like NDP-sugar epimerase